MNSAQKGHGRRLGGRINSSRPTSGVNARDSKNQPNAERPNSRDASTATARARTEYRPIPISICVASLNSRVFLKAGLYRHDRQHGLDRFTAGLNDMPL